MPIQWDADAMTVGLEDVDQQHVQLVCYFNQFDEAVARNGDLELIESTLRFLERYSRMVFRSEEVLMTMWRDPFAVDHLAAHAALLNDMDLMLTLVSRGQVARIGIAALRTDLGKRLTAHLKVMDRNLREPVH